MNREQSYKQVYRKQCVVYIAVQYVATTTTLKCSPSSRLIFLNHYFFFEIAIGNLWNVIFLFVSEYTDFPDDLHLGTAHTRLLVWKMRINLDFYCSMYVKITFLSTAKTGASVEKPTKAGQSMT